MSSRVKSIGSKKMEKFILRKNVVIPKGSVFMRAPKRIENYESMFEHIIGLTDHTSGSILYGIDEDDPKISEWFEKVVE
jgi:hypothetical protein